MTTQYADEQRLQGTIYSGKSAEFDYGQGPVEGVLKAGGEAKRTRKIVYGSRRDGQPLGKTAGKFEPGSLTIAMLATTAKQFEAYLATTGGGQGSIGDPTFALTVSLYEPDITNDDPITWSFGGVTVESQKESWDEGIEEIVTEYTLQFLQNPRNGNVLWSIIRGQE
jgi:hypothetical protein